MDFVCDKAAEAVNEAIDRLQPAWIKIATGEAQGKIAYNYYAPDLYDRRMSVIQAVEPRGQDDRHAGQLRDPSRRCSATASASSAPTWSARSASGSKSQAGGMALFMNGAQGGMVTADNRNLDQPSDPHRGYWDDSRTWEECLRIGHLMADEALRIVEDAPEQNDPALSCDSIRVRFPSSRTRCGPSSSTRP